jgi:hypothetical protein
VDTSIEVRYAGVVVGRTSQARELGTGDGGGLFVGIAEPLPVGTLVTLKIGDAVREARVAEVVEAADPSSVGMRVSFDVGARDAPPAPVAAAAPAVVSPEPVQDAPSAAVAAESEASEAISAPLSLAEPGGGKRRKKRR